MKKRFAFLNNTTKIIYAIIRLTGRFSNYIPDELYLKIAYKSVMGKKLNLDNPKTFNEKLQWLKINNRNPEYTTMVDKYAVKKYIADKIGPEYIIPTLGVWDKFDEIDFKSLPNQFVLKCTHDSGGLVVCQDKAKLDMAAARKKIEKSLSNNFYYMGREWPYKNVPHRIIAEQYMADDLRDYKLFCFNGVPRMTLVCSERFTKDGLKEDFYDEAWSHLNVQKPEHGNAIFPIERSKQYELMKDFAVKLSEKMPFARIDFYEINETVYFGEITFYSADEFEGFKPEEWDLNLGEWVKLPGGYRLNSDACSIIVSNSYYNSKETKALVDYKFFCFDGKIDSVMVCMGREKGHPDFYFYDMQWNRLYYQHDYLEKDSIIKKPDNFNEMKNIVEQLCKGLCHIRVDLYDIAGNIYFGELTFFDNSGFDTDISYETDKMWGEKMRLPKRKII